mmetsp:Transcript_3121/g.7255  ORF Transcript_3121/g.7255 Transcript_3121/m.7255 type:complete len:283 (+) Transcript_3121:792-1640(+)
MVAADVLQKSRLALSRQRVEGHDHIHTGHARDAVVYEKFDATCAQSPVSSHRSREHRSCSRLRACNHTASTLVCDSSCSCRGVGEDVLERTEKSVAGRLRRNDHHARDRGIEGKGSHHRHYRCASVRKTRSEVPRLRQKHLRSEEEAVVRRAAASCSHESPHYVRQRARLLRCPQQISPARLFFCHHVLRQQLFPILRDSRQKSCGETASAAPYIGALCFAQSRVLLYHLRVELGNQKHRPTRDEPLFDSGKEPAVEIAEVAGMDGLHGGAEAIPAHLHANL